MLRKLQPFLKPRLYLKAIMLKDPQNAFKRLISKPLTYFDRLKRLINKNKKKKKKKKGCDRRNP